MNSSAAETLGLSRVSWVGLVMDENASAILRQYNVTQEDLSALQDLINSSSKYEMTHCYCSGTLREFLVGYRAWHGYLSLVVCVFGTVANALNVAVLTRKEMVSAPINRILTALAVADMLVMLEYMPFAIYQYLVSPGQDMPYRGAVFVLFHSHFTQVLHTISICLTLALAIWRYIAISYPERSYILCSDHRCTLAIGLSYTLPFLVCIPSYFVFNIKESFVLQDGQVVLLYHIELEDELLSYINLWIYGVVIKLLPCGLLTLISCCLIRALYSAHRRKQLLKGYNTNNSSVTKSERRADRTTRMLVAILLLFLITEFPQGILGLLSGLLGKCFFRTCYYLFGEVMDILALLNGAINFILYCAMSRQFRMTFSLLFKPHVLVKWTSPASQTEVQSTYV